MKICSSIVLCFIITQNHGFSDEDLDQAPIIILDSLSDYPERSVDGLPSKRHYESKKNKIGGVFLQKGDKNEGKEEKDDEKPESITIKKTDDENEAPTEKINPDEPDRENFKKGVEDFLAEQAAGNKAEILDSNSHYYQSHVYPDLDRRFIPQNINNAGKGNKTEIVLEKALTDLVSMVARESDKLWPPGKAQTDSRNALNPKEVNKEIKPTGFVPEKPQTAEVRVTVAKEPSKLSQTLQGHHKYLKEFLQEEVSYPQPKYKSVEELQAPAEFAGSAKLQPSEMPKTDSTNGKYRMRFWKADVITTTPASLRSNKDKNQDSNGVNKQKKITEIIPQKAPVEEVLAAAREAAKKPPPEIPPTDSKDSLRTGNYWNGFLKEEVNDPIQGMQRSGPGEDTPNPAELKLPQENPQSSFKTEDTKIINNILVMGKETEIPVIKEKAPQFTGTTEPRIFPPPEISQTEAPVESTTVTKEPAMFPPPEITQTDDRTEDHWNKIGFTVEDVTSSSSDAVLRSVKENQILNAVRAKIKPGHEFYDVVKNLQKISSSPRLVYIINSSNN